MFLGKAHQTKLQLCAICGYELDGVSQINGDKLPKPGDVSICIGCANIALYDDDLKLRQPNLDEERELLRDPVIVEAQNKVLLYLAIRELEPELFDKPKS